MTDEKMSNTRDEEIIKQRAEAMASREMAKINAVDRYLARMDQAVAEGRVRFDDFRDFDTLVRLKAFLAGWPCMRAAGSDEAKMPEELVAQVEEMLARWEGAPRTAETEVR